MNQRVRTALGTLTLLLGLSILAPAQGVVWTVDDTPGPDVDFNSIQAAVDAAADLDLIVVREGFYNFFKIAGKGLTVVGDGEVLLNPAIIFASKRIIEVSGVPAGKSVVLRGLDVAPFIASDDAPAVYLSGNAGPILLEDMQLSTPLGPAISIFDCAAVTISRCSASGGTEVDAFGGVYLTHAGIFARDSDVYVYDTTAQGSAGGNAAPGMVFPPLPTLLPGAGAAGVQIQGGSLLATGSTFLGGNSGADGPGLCFAGQDGGAGLLVQSFTTVPVVRLLDTALVGGAGGVVTGAGCVQPGGAPGPGQLVSAGTVENLPGTARSFDWDTPVVGGQPFDMSFTGQPGDLALLLITIGPGPDAYLTGYGAALLIDPVYILAVIDVLPAGGTLTQTLTAVEPGFVQYFRLCAQAAFIDPTAQFFLSAPSTLTILKGEDAEDKE